MSYPDNGSMTVHEFAEKIDAEGGPIDAIWYGLSPRAVREESADHPLVRHYRVLWEAFTGGLREDLADCDYYLDEVLSGE